MSTGACTITLANGKQYGIALPAGDVAERTKLDRTGISQLPQRASDLGLWVRHGAIVAIEEAPTR